MKTELELRIALAEVQGLKGPWIKTGSGMMNLKNDWLPEFTLDWVHEIEKGLKRSQQRTYGEYLTASNPDGLRNQIVALYHAAKEQRSEAILRTLGLWKD